MTKKIPLSEWYAYLEQLLKDRTGYIYGTAGVKCTQAVIDQCIARYPKNADITRRYGPQWIGHKVTDCSGVPLPIAKKYGIRLPHGSSSLVRQGYIVDCGPDPHPGWAALADPTPDTPDNKHIGYVGPDGFTIYEARGTRDGFCTSTIEDKRWTKYGRMTFIDYGETSSGTETSSTAAAVPLPQRGRSGEAEESNDGKETETMPEDGGIRVYYRAEVVTEQGKLNVRSGPGTEYGVLFKLARGSVVDVLFEYPSGWDWISDDGDHGYVCHKYLRKVEPSQSAVADSSPGGGAKDGETSSGTETTSDAAQGEGIRTILRHKGEDHITIGLMGEWEIVGVQGDDQVERGD